VLNLPKRHIAALILTLMVGNAYSVIVMGARSCGDWIKNKPIGLDKNWARVVSEAWLVGYLSGMASSSGKDILRDMTASSIFVWMDNYCQANPLDDLDDGGSKLMAELVRRKGL